MPRRANTQTQQEAVQENAAVQADAGADITTIANAASARKAAPISLQ